MQVVAFSSPGRPDWRWRIVSYSGETVEESYQAYPTIATAVADGSRRLEEMNVTDRSAPPRPFRSTSHLRGPARSGRR